MRTKVTGSITVEQTLELDVEVEGNPIPYTPARMYLSNGDPGYPEEGGDVEDLTVYLTRKGSDGKMIRLDITEFVSESDKSRLSEAIIQTVIDADEADRDAAADAAFEQRRDEMRRGDK